MKFFNYSILSVLFCIALTACETDNYTAPDCTIEGKIYDQTNQIFQVNQGAGIIRIREISWAKDSTTYTANQTLKVQQDGTYRNTKIFKGTYRMLPYAGAFFPYDDVNKDGDNAGELVEINKTTTQDFTVVPYLTLEWVKKPTVDATGYLSCSIKFTRNQKPGYDMPDLRQAVLHVSRVINADASDGDLFTKPLTITNDQEGTEISFKTDIPLRFHGINYWVRISMNTQTAAGNPQTNYPGMGASNYSTIEEIFVQ